MSEKLSIKICSNRYWQMRELRNQTVRYLADIQEITEYSLWNKDVRGGVLHTAEILTNYPIAQDQTLVLEEGLLPEKISSSGQADEVLFNLDSE